MKLVHKLHQTPTIVFPKCAIASTQAFAFRSLCRGITARNSWRRGNWRRSVSCVGPSRALIPGCTAPLQNRFALLRAVFNTGKSTSPKPPLPAFAHCFVFLPLSFRFWALFRAPKSLARAAIAPVPSATVTRITGFGRCTGRQRHWRGQQLHQIWCSCQSYEAICQTAHWSLQGFRPHFSEKLQDQIGRAHV